MSSKKSSAGVDSKKENKTLDEKISKQIVPLFRRQKQTNRTKPKYCVAALNDVQLKADC